MSLINDALKKAKQAQVNAPARESAPQLRSPEADHPVRSGPSLVLPAIVVAVGLIGATLVWMAMSHKQDDKKAESVVAQNSSTLAKTEPAVATKSEERVSTPPTPALPVSDAAAPSVTVAPPESKQATAASESTAVAISAKPKPPTLNGIFYNPTKPTAIVNNKLVSIGSRVGEFTVLTITQSSVSLAGGGQTNVLSLSE